MANPKTPNKPITSKQQNPPPKPDKQQPPPSWSLIKTLFPSKPQIQKSPILPEEEQPTKKKPKKMKCSGSLCSNTKVMHRPEAAAAAAAASSSSSPPDEHKKPKSNSINPPHRSIVKHTNSSSSSSSLKSSSFSSTNFSSSSSNSGSSGSSRGMPFRKLSGCYECRMVVDPVLGFTRDSSLRAAICSCSHCGEIFMKPEHLELHQAVRHAVSELGPEDTSKNIVEIIFQSSWLRKNSPICKIDRILKIQNTPKKVSSFEEYRESIKSKATKFPKKHPRCIADGNELLRFHCTTLNCSLGLDGSSSLCNSISNCKVCSIIKSGFRVAGAVEAGGEKKGILTTATSGKAHDSAEVAPEIGRRAMLVCRVIAGRVKKNVEGSAAEEYDSVAGAAGVYANFEELFVFNPKAILPCFVVIYGGF